MLTSLYAYTFLRARAISVEKVPGSGAVILAPNHFSFMDHFLMGCYIRRKVRFMAKSQLFKPPMQFIYTHGGVFPVRRGARDEEMFITATLDPRARRRHHDVLRGRALAHRQSRRAGQARDRAPRAGDRRADRADRDLRLLAHPQLEAPAVPQGHRPVRRRRSAGSRSQDPTREQQQAVADQVLVEIRRLYGGLEQHGRKGILRRVREQRRAERRAPEGAPSPERRAEPSGALP